MRKSLLTWLLLLAGCTSPLPEPRPDQAWIGLRHPPGTFLLAAELDGRQWPDGRYFEVAPGKHRLELRFDFEAAGGARDGLAESNWRSCRLLLDYEGFAGGQRYQVRAGIQGLRPWLRLYDSANRLLARGRLGACR